MALWNGLERTSSASTNVIAYAIAVPAYRMVQALVPELEQFVVEQQCVDAARDGVRLLVQVLGPQNAFYVLKYLYETVNSEEAYDMFLLCQDVVRESLDGENYRQAGASLFAATGLKELAPVVKEVYQLLPSLDEVVDVVSVVGDIAGEVVQALASASAESPPDWKHPHAIVMDQWLEGLEEDGNDDDCQRFEVVASDSENESNHSTVSVEDDVSREESVVDAFALDFSEAFDFSADSFAGDDDAPTSPEPFAELFDAGVSFFQTVCDSEEATSLLHTFADFVDVLVD
ncbi:hypothetical protein PINS_up002329 [Pythium insidiosum]|nr:hypothetical protein PINS_up002329 [Pythium insidiosum]